MNVDKDSDIEPEHRDVCHVTGLPILRKPEWKDIYIDDNFSVTFSLVGKAILCAVLNGTISRAGTQKFFAEREKVLIEAGLLDNKYAEVVDYSMYAGYPSKEIRMMIANYLVKEVSTGNLLGFWVFNPPVFIRWMYTVSTKLYKKPVSVCVVRDYKEAVKNAVNVLEKSGVDVGVKQYTRVAKDEWVLELEAFGVRFELIGDDTQYSIAHGSMREAYIEKLFNLHEKFLDEAGLAAKGFYYHILSWEKLEKTTWKARKLYIDAVKDLNQKVPCKLSVLFGLNKFMTTIISFSKQFVPVPVATAPNFEEAMAVIEREKKKRPGTEVAKNIRKPDEALIDREINKYSDELLQFMGAINWDQEGTAWEDISDSHPFKSVFGAMAIIKKDVDDLFRERKQSEERLQKSEERYRQIIEETTDVIYTADAMGYCTYVNPPGEKLTGYPTDELIGKHFIELARRDWCERIQLFYLKQFKEHEHETRLEFPITTKTGEDKWVEQIVTLLSEGNRVIGFQSIVRDISIRKQAEDALRESEEKYRTILKNIEDGYFEVDLTGKLTFFNDTLCRIIGYSRDELLGRNNREYMDEETVQEVYKTYVRIYETGEPVKGLEYAIRKDGKEKHVEASVSLMKDRKDQPVGFRGIIRDVSERKQAEEMIRQYSEHLEAMVEQRTEDLKKSEEKYRTILENIEDGYYEIDLDGNLTFFNDAVCRITGYSEDELMGMNNRDYTDKKNARKLYQEYTKIYETGIPAKRFDWEMIKKDDTKRFLETSISLITGLDDQSTGFRGIIRDVTERKELEHELMQKRKLAEKASKAKSEFLANMSHEIRTPLNGIIGMAELAFDTNLDDEQKILFSKINKEADALLDLINTILDFSKIEAGKIELEEIPFDFRRLIEDIAQSFAYRAEQKGLNFVSYLPPEVPSQLIGDPGRLRQILINLAGNAMKFTHEGEIYLKGELAENLEDRVKIRILVKDTGIGIPKDKQSIIFEDFTQADGSTTRKYGGTGLGTTISKQLAELMGGEIGVESEEGKGSTFWFTAVFTKQTGQKLVLAKEEIDLNDLRVLVVDDNPTNRFIQTEYLRFWGCLPVEASNGKDALSILNQSVLSEEPFNLILTDFQMPGMSGFDLAGEIRAIDDLKTIPIIVITSAGKIGDGKSCRDIGIDGYLTKPIKRDDLRKAIESVLGHSVQTEDQTGSRLFTRHTTAESYQKKIPILLVEDYPTNQLVAMGHLHSAGYQVDLAENGQQAVESFKRKQYDMILMDIQMPEMDGYEATKAIRDLENELHKIGEKKEAGKQERIPIIAMTAHAIKGYKEKCLKAGMDDYITKPLKRKIFLDIIDKWSKANAIIEILPSARKDFSHQANPELEEADGSKFAIQNLTPKTDKDDVPMNFEMILDDFEGDRELLVEAMNLFLESVKNQIKALHQAILDGDAEWVKREAHSIKGGAANLTADDLSRIAFELENSVTSDTLEASMIILERLEIEFYRLESFAKGL